MAKKEFKAGRYAVIVGIILAVVLSSLTVFAFKTRYTAYSPEKVAQNYVDTIVQTGDGYNAYKVTLVSENKKLKYGDFIRRAFMVPYVNDGENVKQADFVGKGTKEEQQAIDKVYNTMYDYLLTLIDQYSFDDYENIFNNYFKKLSEVRKQVYGDEYMDYDYMFGAFEANVDTYGKSLTGVKAQEAKQGQAAVKEVIGKYQEIFGKDYHLTTTVKSCEKLSDEESKAYIEGFKTRIAPIAKSGEAKANQFKLEGEEKENMIGAYEKLDCSDDLTGAAKAVVEVTDQNGNVIATQELYMVAVKNSWYVDNTNISTKGLYLAK